MLIKIRFVRDEVIDFVDGIEEWLRVDDNVDWLLIRGVPCVLALGFAAVCISFILR